MEEYSTIKQSNNTVTVHSMLYAKILYPLH